MTIRRAVAIVALAALGSILAESVMAQSTEPKGAIQVRKDCGSLGEPDCFETLPAARAWIDGVRIPSPSAPLIVDIGAGRWVADLDCERTFLPNGPGWIGPRMGFITWRGAGRSATILTQPPDKSQTIFIQACEELEFRDLTIESDGAGVFWKNHGSSTWTNIDIITTGEADGYVGGWVEDYCYPHNLSKGLHYFFSTRIRSKAGNPGAAETNSAFWGACNEFWYYGGEIEFITEGISLNRAHDAAVAISRETAFHAFGTRIKLHVKAGPGPGGIRGQAAAVSVNDERAGDAPGNETGNPNFPTTGGQFHMHGGSIEVVVDDDANLRTVSPGKFTPIGLRATELSGYSIPVFSHTLATRFEIDAPDTVVPHRIVSNGTKVHSPVLNVPGTRPPGSNDESNRIVSETGQDLWVETDCKANGDCDSSTCEASGTCGDYVGAHLMSYNAEVCTGPGGPWLDTVTGRCRNDTTDPLEDALADLDAAKAAVEAALSSIESRVDILEGGP